MKKIYFLLAALLLSTFASWAVTISFTIYPEASGTFHIYYSTYKAPAERAVFVDWTGDEVYDNYPEAETGSNPSKHITGTVTKGKPIKIYSDYLDAIYIADKAQAIKCEANNPQLQYIYYFQDNLSPENLEALYMSLISRNGKDGYGELHLSDKESIADAKNNVLKSNAFIPVGINWRVCSMKNWTGSTSYRIYWELDEANCKSWLIPAMEISTPTTANITDLQLGIKQSVQLPWNISSSIVRIDDGTSNHKSVNVSSYTTNTDFVNNAPKLTVKGAEEEHIIRIYGAMVSHIKTSQINIIQLFASNLRYLFLNNCSLVFEDQIQNQTQLDYLHLYHSNIKELDLRTLLNLKTLSVANCPALTSLYFNKTSLESLSFDECNKLKLTDISNLNDAPKLTEISASNIGWDACTMNELYADLRNPAPSGAKIYVENEDLHADYNNDWIGSNKDIATNKGWSVIRKYNGGAEQKLTGDGGGCKPGVVTCLSPNNGAIKVSVNDVNLTFGFGANTSQYQFKWGKNFNQFSNVTSYKTTGGNTGFAYSMPKLDYNTTYYWQVNVKDKNGNERMGEIWSFTTEADPKAAAATCLVPTINGNSALLSITFGANTEDYEVRWGKNKSSLTSTSNWKSAVGMSGSDYTIANLDYSTKYYFQINTRNKQVDVTNSNTWDFTTAAPAATKPVAASNVAPKNGATNIDNGTSLSWTLGDNTSEYQVMLGTSSTPLDVVVPFTNTLKTSHTLAGLKPNTKYYWQVNARNASGITPGPVWSFTTALNTGIYSPEAEAIQVYAYGNALHLVTTSQDDAQVDVYNITGQLVMQGKTNGNTHSTFNTSALCNGIYVVKVVQDNKVVVSRKVPIQNQ